jgi:2-amino-4-hydroxy-6-hydroxymethyldihydropteridine diphosphokinase
MTRAFVGVGSNINPEENVREALRLLARHVRVVAVSTVYATAAIGRPRQPPFHNCVVEIETTIPPPELKRRVLHDIERELGRVRTADKYAPRTIDLDLLIYGDVVSAGDPLLPDPDIERRPFLAAGLAEVAPELRLPGSGRPISEIAAELSDGDLRALPEYTDMLRRDINHER